MQLHPNERIYYQGTNIQLHDAFVMIVIINFSYVIATRNSDYERMA